MKLFIGLVLSIVAAQTCYAQSPCELCGVGLAVTNLDEIVPLPGQNPPITCAELQQLGREGQIPLGQCDAAAVFVLDICGCAPIIAPPSVAPMDDTPSTLGPGVYPPCSICGEGMRITLRDPVISIPGFDLEPTCEEFEEAGFQGQIPASNCPFVPPLIRDLCGCSSTESAAPTGAPVAPSRSPIDNGLGPANHPPCSICGEGMRVTLPDQMFAAPPGLEFEPTCEDVEEAGLRGQLDALKSCETFPTLFSELCGCAPGEAPPVAPPPPPPPPTDSPSPTTISCSVCGPGRQVSSPEAIFVFPGQPSVPCSVLEEAGLNRIIPPDQCPFLPTFVTIACNCVEIAPVEPPTSLADADAPPTLGPRIYPPCSICGVGMRITVLDQIVSIPGLAGMPTCEEFEDAGFQGQIPESNCPFVPAVLGDRCGCAAGDAPEGTGDIPTLAPTSCSVCGPGNEVSFPDAIFAFPGQPSIPCGVLEEMGAIGDIPDDQCPFLPALISDLCNCLPIGTPIVSRPPTTCNVCGEGRKVSSPDAILEQGLGEPDISCGALDTDGAAGLISANDCPLFQLLAMEVCNCVPTAGIPIAPAPVVAPVVSPMTTMMSSSSSSAKQKMMSKRGKDGMRMSQMMMM